MPEGIAFPEATRQPAPLTLTHPVPTSVAPAQWFLPSRSRPVAYPSAVCAQPPTLTHHHLPIARSPSLGARHPPPSLGARRLTASVTTRTLPVNAKAQSHALLFHSFIFIGPSHMTETLQIQQLDAFHRRTAIHRHSHLTHCMSAYRGQSHISLAGVSPKMSLPHIE